MDKLTRTQKAIADECDAVKALLLRKNKAYGDSAINPLRIFARYPAEVLLRARIDDKLARISRGNENDVSEDTVQDLLGYLILWRVERRLRGGRRAQS